MTDGSLMFEQLNGIRHEPSRTRERRMGSVDDAVGRLVRNDMSRDRDLTALKASVARTEDRLNLRDADI